MGDLLGRLQQCSLLASRGQHQQALELLAEGSTGNDAGCMGSTGLRGILDPAAASAALFKVKILLQLGELQGAREELMGQGRLLPAHQSGGGTAEGEQSPEAIFGFKVRGYVQWL